MNTIKALEPVFVIFKTIENGVRVGPCHRRCAEWGGWEIIKDIITPGESWVCGHCGKGFNHDMGN
jgi:hypothetical protein